MFNKRVRKEGTSMQTCSQEARDIQPKQREYANQIQEAQEQHRQTQPALHTKTGTNIYHAQTCAAEPNPGGNIQSTVHGV
jgi:hypothetical protein